MKKEICIVLSILLFSSYAIAQTAEPEKPVKTGDEWKMPSDVFKRSQSFADSLKKMLGLDAAATKKVYDAYLANTKPIDEIRVLPISDDEKKERLKANHEDFNATLKGILSAEQYRKYLTLNAGVSASESKDLAFIVLRWSFFRFCS